MNPESASRSKTRPWFPAVLPRHGDRRVYVFLRHLEAMLLFHVLNHGIGKRVVGRGGHAEDLLPDGDDRVKPWLILRDHR